MSLLRCGLTALLLLSMAIPVGAAEKANPQETPQSTVAELIRLLEAKDYPTLMTNLVSPDDLKKILEKVSLDELAKGFGESNKPARLLAILKKVQNQEPEFPNENTAVFTVKEDPPVVPRPQITFTRVDKKWYIKN